MTDRSATKHTNTNGPQSYAHDCIYWIDAKPETMWPARIKGLFPAEVYDWVANIPPRTTAIELLSRRATMNDIDKESWATHLTEANKKTFQKFVDRENRTEWLTAIIEAEANRENPRSERIAYVNKRKQEL